MRAQSPVQKICRRLSLLFAGVALLTLTAACSSETGAATGAAAASGSSGGGVAAAAVAETLDTQYFTLSLPQGWEVMADDLDSMGLMTLAKKGTGGAQGVYLKFEPGSSTDPLAAIEKFAASYKGSPAEQATRNGVDWARTRFTYNGIEQSLNITAQGGRKVTFTVMGDDYDSSPGVRTIFDSVTFK